MMSLNDTCSLNLSLFVLLPKSEHNNKHGNHFLLCLDSSLFQLSEGTIDL